LYPQPQEWLLSTACEWVCDPSQSLH
jgi:hypothetical protein